MAGGDNGFHTDHGTNLEWIMQLSNRLKIGTEMTYMNYHEVSSGGLTDAQFAEEIQVKSLYSIQKLV